MGPLYMNIPTIAISAASEANISTISLKFSIFRPLIPINQSDYIFNVANFQIHFRYLTHTANLYLTDLGENGDRFILTQLSDLS